MTIKINIDMSLASELKRQAETGAHVHSSNSNKEPIVGSTCLYKSPLCSWLGASVAESLFITPTECLCPLPLCHVRLLSLSLSDSLGGFISMQRLYLKGSEIQALNRGGGFSFDSSHRSHVSRLKFHNTGKAHRVIQCATEPASFSLPLPWPAAVAELPHISSYYWLPWRNYPETSLRLSGLIPACSRPRTQGREPKQLSNPNVTSLSRYNLICAHSCVS